MRMESDELTDDVELENQNSQPKNIKLADYQTWQNSKEATIVK